MVFSVSPAVVVREIDATASIPAVASTTGAIAGVFRWGPVDERVLVTSESNLVSRFGKPTDFNAETFFTAADFLAYSNSLYVVRVSDGANTATDGVADVVSALYPGELGNSLKISYVTGASSFSTSVFDAGDITANVDFGSTTLSFDHTPSMALANNDILRIGNATIGYQDINVIEVAETEVDANTSSYVVTTEDRFSLAVDDMSTLEGEKKWKYYNSVDNAPSTNKFHLVVVDEDGEASGTAGTILEVYEDVSTVETDKTLDGTSNYYKDVFTSNSAWITYGDNDISTASDTFTYVSLTSGSDGNGENTDTQVSFGAIALGLDLFKNADEVDVAFIMQGQARGGSNDTGVANYIIGNICESRKDCVAFVSPAKADVVAVANDSTKLNNVIAYADSLQASSYSFVDSGYKYRYDKYNDKYRYVPLNGDMAGLAARIDPWQSPAGFKRGGVKNVVKLAYSPIKEHRDQLYGKNVNSVINQQGRGTVLFGDKTGLGNPTSAFNYLNVRRLFIVVEKVIATASRDFLFEFNNEVTQSRFINMVEPYLRDVQGRQGIIDFRVVADSSVNTADVIDAGKFVGNIFIKPSRTIQLMELNFVATKTGVEFDEIVGQAL